MTETYKVNMTSNELETRIRERIKAYEDCLKDLRDLQHEFTPDEILKKYNIGDVEDHWYLCDSLYNTLDELCGLLGEKWEGERENYCM